jgi:peptidyl-prolyl cis-trans isomerase SurA
MNKILIAFIAFFFALSAASLAQTDPVLVSIAGENITRSEFEKVFKKNNRDEKMDRKAIEDYLDLFINYKLKVKEAIDSGLDTAKNFVDELAGYRKQLAQPYMTDKAVTEKLLREAYDRMKSDVRASHILATVGPDALPRDTVAAHLRISIIRDFVNGKNIETAKVAEYEAMIKKNLNPKSATYGKDSADAAKRINSMKELAKQKPAPTEDRFAIAAMTTSEDPSAKDNSGDLGYFSALMMVYPFETAAYNAKKGEVSTPVRTRFGFHIIKVTDSRPNPGEVKVAHIMAKAGAASADLQENMKAKAKIDTVFAKLKAGDNFEDLAREFSDDPGSARTGGVLPQFGTGRMVPEFEAAAFALKKIGDYSEPVRTSFGWHIIKLLERKPLAPFDSMQSELKSKVAKDSRSDLSKTSFINRVKSKYNFKEMPKAKDEFFKVIDSTLAEATWTKDKAEKLTKPLFTLGEKTYTQQNLTDFVASRQSKKSGTPLKALFDNLYNDFVNQSCLDYEESRLEINYPDFKSLMQEYHDGILLFDLTDKKVWSKAVKDTTGLQEFYTRNKTNYMWGERVEASIYSCYDAEVSKKVRKSIDKGLRDDSLLAVYNKENLWLQIKPGIFSKGDDHIIDSIPWVAGKTGDFKKDDKVAFVNVKRKMAPEPKTLDEARGMITADYQQFLEKDWIDSLRKKYSYTVHKDVVESLIR